MPLGSYFVYDLSLPSNDKRPKKKNTMDKNSIDQDIVEVDLDDKLVDTDNTR